ncbi:MAG: NAD(P)H-dependent oxidoreductase subunit E [Bacteroidota bacterium]|nr:NAD(P)H-dependent oxidoreductase subunit E [Bacteroidota bacterium]
MEPKVSFSEETLKLSEKIISHYPEGRQKSALIPILHLAQAEFGGWLSVEAMDYVAGLLKLKPIEIYEVATFYTMYNLKPTGKCVIEVCRTGPCWLMGAEKIIEHLEKKLGIKAGETTTDGKFTLKVTECLAACGNSPVIQIGEKYYVNMDVEKADNLIQNLNEGMRV